jgi:predicted PurR-regulated permease PerM
MPLFTLVYIFIPLLIISILAFCVSLVLLIIKRKSLRKLSKNILIILLILSSIFILFSIVLFSGFYNQKTEYDITENQPENLTDWAEIYKVTLNSYLEQFTGLKEDIDFIAIDLIQTILIKNPLWNGLR